MALENSSYNSWADQWDTKSEYANPQNKKKNKVGDGFGKTKTVAITGMKKVKQGTSIGISWIKQKISYYSTAMKTTFYSKRLALLLVILMIDHVFQTNSASIEGAVFSGRNRKLRTRSSPPPAPKLSRSVHYKFAAQPPPPSIRCKATSSPQIGLPWKFCSFLSPPPPPRVPLYR
ncbi:hypothetical protein L1987_58379 [Smallanthus sonchifolius]|uniref:Uncharacterized protein n=1 Tax=Smallanthus sonchifolius TaxID=185202 RepID=A0ACB9DF20_9ASTR|nr:hypothetical protein L1987_58379 [Smallanthus sonchifolius]